MSTQAGNGGAFNGTGDAESGDTESGDTDGAESDGMGGAESDDMGSAESGGMGGAESGGMGGAESGGMGGAESGDMGGAESGGSAGDAGNSGTIFPPFSSPTTITTVSEEPHHGCQESEAGSVIISPVNVFSDGVLSVQPALMACEHGDWWPLGEKVTTFFDRPVSHTWVGILTVAVAGNYADTVSVMLLEGEQNFINATCYSHSKGSVSKGAYGGSEPQPEQVICDGFNTELYGDLGTFKARLVRGAPSVVFYPKDGSAAVTLTVVDL